MEGENGAVPVRFRSRFVKSDVCIRVDDERRVTIASYSNSKRREEREGEIGRGGVDFGKRIKLFTEYRMEEIVSPAISLS